MREVTVAVSAGRSEDSSRGRRLLFFATAWSIIALLSAYIIAPAPVFPLLKDALQVGNTSVGALVSVVFLSAILAQIPGGYLIDRASNRRIIALSAASLTVASVPVAFVFDYPAVLVSRILAGLFLPLIFISLTNLIGAVFSKARLRTLGLLFAAPSAGHALGIYVTPYVASALGLPSIFAIYTLPILLLLPLAHWASSGVGEDRGPMFPLRQYIAAFRSRELWKLGVAFACTLAVYVLFASWMPSFLEAEGGLSPQASGSVVALLPGLGILSIPLGGLLADTHLRGDRRGVPLISFLSLLPLTLLWIDGRAISWALLLLPLVGFFSQLPIGVYYALSSQALPRRLTGSAYSFMNVVSMAGGVATPLVGGYLLDIAGSFRPIFLLASGFSLVGVGVALRLGRS